MSRCWVSTFVVCMALSSYAYSLNLNDPIATESTSSWQKISADVSVCYIPDADRDGLSLIIDRGEYMDPIFLSYAQTQDRIGLSNFLKKCEKTWMEIEQAQQKRLGILVHGAASHDLIREWLDKMSIQKDLTMNSQPLEFFSPSRLQTVKAHEATNPHLILSYAFSFPDLKTVRDMRKLLAIELIQEMATRRLAHAGVQLVSSEMRQKDLLPTANWQIFLPVEEGSWSDVFQMTLEKMKEIRDLGFNMEELQISKKECLFRLQALQRGSSSDKWAAFKTQSFLQGLDDLSDQAFFEYAEPLLESITPVDIAIVMHECFAQDQMIVTYVSPYEVNASWLVEAQEILSFVVQENVQQTVLLQTQMDAPEMLFEHLPLSDTERGIIYKIFDTMARDNVIKLGLKRKTMEKKGKKIRNVHPLRLLGYVFGDPHLHHCMREISRSMFKWNGFIDGMKDRIDEEARNGNLLPYVPGFAAHLRVDEAKVRKYIEKRDWDGLARYLL